MKRFIFFLLFLLLSLALMIFAVPQEQSFDTYHNPDAVNSLLKSWGTKYSQLAKIINIGKSEGNTDLLVLRIAAEGRVDPDSRTAVFVSANLEGTHLVGTEAALMIAQKLLTGYDSDEKITRLLQDKTVYVAPLLNPDAAQSYFSDVRYEKQTNGKPTDDDADGLVDEDGPDDLNKDGQITIHLPLDRERLFRRLAEGYGLSASEMGLKLIEGFITSQQDQLQYLQSVLGTQENSEN